MRKTKSDNQELVGVIQQLVKAGAVDNIPLWHRIASDLSRSSRQRRIVNLTRLDRCTEANDLVVVPGKVLSVGELTHKVDVAAFSFSGSAREKIMNAKGKALTIQELMKSNPKGKGVKIIG